MEYFTPPAAGSSAAAGSSNAGSSAAGSSNAGSSAAPPAASSTAGAPGAPLGTPATPAAPATPAKPAKPEEPEVEGTDVTLVVMIALAVIFVLSVLFIISGNVFSFIVLVLLVAILSFVLIHYGFIKIKSRDNQLDIMYYPVPSPPEKPKGAEAPSSATGTPPPYSSYQESEVFYVADNTFTFDKAENVCKAYGAELATYSQVEQAYNSGAEWCGYGWSVGGLALFPTQKESWEKRQMNETSEEKRQLCGRPGINGGYFDPKMKFGVNCYGHKPDKKREKEKEKRISDNDREIGYLKDHLDDMLVLPFNKGVWSESESNIIDSSTNTSSQAPVPQASQESNQARSRTTSQHAASAVRGAGSAAVGVIGHVGSGAGQFLKDLADV